MKTKDNINTKTNQEIESKIKRVAHLRSDKDSSTLKTKTKITNGVAVQEFTNRSAGVVIIRFIEEQPMVLLMRAYNYWDFPKGKIELDERVIEAAKREVKEESGLSDLHFKWGMEHFQTEPYGQIKKVAIYFLAETKTEQVIMAINPEIGKAEHDEYKWLTFDDAKKITVRRVQDVLNWAENKLSYDKLFQNNLTKSNNTMKK